MPRDADDDRPKKSWREIDQSREKGGQRTSDSGRPSPRHERSAAYRNYKTQLDRLFDGGALPGVLQAKLGDTPVASEAKARKEAAALIAQAATPKACREALEAYVGVHGFPEDEAALAKLVDLGSEKTVLRAIEALAALQAAGSLKRGASLKARLKTAQITMDDPAIRQAAAALLAQL